MADTTHVFVVEDDASMRESVSRGLRRLGFEVSEERDGAAALRRILADPFDMVLLDVMLPSLDGLSVCREVRRRSQVPIIILTARDQTPDLIRGLDCGADDYVTKPFELGELAARIRSVLRRCAATDVERIIVGDLQIDTGAVRVSRNGDEMQLSATEFRLLVELARSAGQTITREELLHRVWATTTWGSRAWSTRRSSACAPGSSTIPPTRSWSRPCAASATASWPRDPSRPVPSSPLPAQAHDRDRPGLSRRQRHAGGDRVPGGRPCA